MHSQPAQKKRNFIYIAFQLYDTPSRDEAGDYGKRNGYRKAFRPRLGKFFSIMIPLPFFFANCIHHHTESLLIDVIL